MMTTTQDTGSRITIEARLIALNAQARRQLRRDPYGRENEAWAHTHRRMNRLLDGWESARTTTPEGTNA